MSPSATGRLTEGDSGDLRRGARGGGLLRSRLGRRTFRVFAGCAIVPVLCLAALTLVQVSRKLEESAYQRLLRSAKAAGMVLFDRLQNLESHLALLGTSLPRSQPQAARVSTLAVVTRFDAVSVIDSGSRACTSILGDAAPAVVREAADSERLRSGASRLVLVPDAGRLRTWLLHGVGDRPGTVVAGRAVDEALWGRDALAPVSGSVVVLDDAARLVYAGDEGAPGVTVPGLGTYAVHQGSLAWSHEGKEMLGAYWRLFARPAFGESFTIVHAQNRDEVLDSLDTFRITFLGLATVTFLVVLLVSLRMLRRTLEPIQQLQVATRRVAAGELAGYVRVDTGDELGELADAFNAMTDQLADSDARRARFEQELVLARDQALRAARIKSEILQNVSHELNTPLTAVRSFVEILRDHDLDPAERAEFLDIVVAESGRLSRLLHRVLDFGALESDDMRWPTEPVELAVVVHRVLAEQEDVAKAAGVELVLARAPGDAAVVHGDSDRLAEALGNLVENAVRFSSRGSAVVVACSEADGRCALEVRDPGCGIDPTDHERVFEGFRQVSADLTTDKPPGLGVGLAIARAIVARHDGSIELESRRGEGATFRILLPQASVPKQPELAGAAADA